MSGQEKFPATSVVDGQVVIYYGPIFFVKPTYAVKSAMPVNKLIVADCMTIELFLQFRFDLYSSFFNKNVDDGVAEKALR